MGRIKTQLVKRVTLELVKLHKEQFKPDFEQNKVLVAQFADVPSKKLKNIIAGYVTRIIRSGKYD